MKISTDPRLPSADSPDYGKQLRLRLNDFLVSIAQQVNGITEGRITPIYNKATAAPTQGDYAQGDFIRNATPTELGSASSKYIIFGWSCVADGNPGTWKECRFLTGN